MKLFVFILSSLFISSAYAVEKNLTVELSTKAVVLKVQAACVARVDFSGDGDYQLYYDRKSFKAVAALEAQGLTATYMSGNVTCEQNWLLKGEGKADFLNYVDVNLYDKNEYVEQQVMVAGGFKEVTVIYYNYTQFEEDFKKATKASLENLF